MTCLKLANVLIKDRTSKEKHLLVAGLVASVKLAHRLLLRGVNETTDGRWQVADDLRRMEAVHLKPTKGARYTENPDQPMSW